ncbi:MAG: type I DNA topoisomerase [bacterium]|nr:type I DNA topoisomerase [bacterium]
MSEAIQVYCVKCREKRDVVEPEAVFTKNGTPALRGKCAVCGTTLFRMGATPAHDGMEKPVIEKSEKSPSPRKSSKTKDSKEASKSPKKGKDKGKSASAPKKRGKSPKNKLVIVESPAKARTISNFLGKEFVVVASKGHVRDLLVTQLSVDVDNDFEPKYRVPNEKRDDVRLLKKEVDNASEIFLATDADREGEAIAWHLIHATDMDESKVERVIFHEITQNAIQEAFAHPRPVDMSLVDAYQARRVLDRLVGYNISELLWDRVRNRLSAGRVQSVAVRLLVDREREIEAFVPEEYWTLDAKVQKQASDKRPFIIRLVKIRDEDVAFKAEGDVKPHLDMLEKSQYMVEDVKRGTRKRRPSAPFTTSTLQQDASRRLGFNAMRTMRTAQQLYEGIDLGAEGTVGLITYMRTDSTNVALQAQEEARTYIINRFNKEFVPEELPKYKTKAKGAQEAHEAIRPTSVLRLPSTVEKVLSRDQFKLYKLIWERFVASQMANAIYDTLRIEVRAGINAPMPYLFRVSGSVVKFQGFLAIYEETRDEDAPLDEDEGRILPEVTVGEVLTLVQLLPEQHFTQAPPRFTEASLVQSLEEHGIGRPSTYAPILKVIQERDYVEKQDKRLIPTETGKLVNDLLVQYFANVVNYQFTAHMEEELDDIAEGDMQWRPMVREFYTPFQAQLEHARQHMPQMRQDDYIGRGCPSCETGQLQIKHGRWGKFIGCDNYPECNYTEAYIELTGVKCPKCGAEHGGELIVRKTKRGRIFYGCSRYPECDYSAWKLPNQGKAQPTTGDDEQDEDERIASYY